MSSEENRRTLALGGGKYILASRMRADDEVTRVVLPRAGRFQTVASNLQVKEVVVGDGARRQRYVVCYNPVEAERQKQHRERVLADLTGPAQDAAQARARWAALEADVRAAFHAALRALPRPGPVGRAEGRHGGGAPGREARRQVGHHVE